MKINNFSTLIYLFNSSLSATNAQKINEREGRIINGYPVQPAFKYPWMVAIYRYGEYWCGGVLISQNTVLTAAHCMGGTKAPLRNFQVHVHRQDLEKSPSEEDAQVFSVIDRKIVGGYDDDKYYNDLAIIKLNNSLKNRTSIQIDTELTHKAGMRSTVLGWGRITPTSAPYHILQEVVLPLYEDKDCVADYAVTNYEIKSDIQICAGFKEGGKDACGGDSGGPLFTYINDQPVLIGIVSNGGGCAAPNAPGIYTRVAKYKDWILNNLK